MTTSRDFAYQVVKTLQNAGYQALWAGGCVRDQLVGKVPKDYDVATNATPDQVRLLFGKKRTLAIGASFGVITVLGPKTADPIEVATFRRDTGYSDGRRPDAIEFTDAREDAIRRDFTINGMFFDPVSEQVIDYVEGQADLRRKVIRAIGNPHERIDEDKLRMLRAVRFAANFDFALDAETLAAIQQHAREINVVSGERIGAELRRMLAHPNRVVALELLRESMLLDQLLPTSRGFQIASQNGSEIGPENELVWQSLLSTLPYLSLSPFSCSVAMILESCGGLANLDYLVEAWKLSNEEKKTIAWVLKHKSTLADASRKPWSTLQPLLIQAESRDALEVLIAENAGERSAGVQICYDRLQLPGEQLNPKPLLDGNDLRELGIKPGPLFGKILKRLRADQLDGAIPDQTTAIEFAKKWSLEEEG